MTQDARNTPPAVGDTRKAPPTAQRLAERAADELRQGEYQVARSMALVAIALALTGEREPTAVATAPGYCDRGPCCLGWGHEGRCRT